MKIIRITKNCALQFLEEAHKPGGRAEHLVEAHENMLFKDGAVNVLGSRKKHTTIVRFLPAMEMENEKLKEQFPTMQGEAIRMMLMGPLGSAASLLGYFFLTEEHGQRKSMLAYGATIAAYRAFYGKGKKKMDKLRNTITLARTMQELILLLQDDMRLHEDVWTAEEVTQRRTAEERWPEDPFEAVFQMELENRKRLTQPDYLFYLNRDFHDLKPASDKQVKWVTDWAEYIRSRMKDPDALQRRKLSGTDTEEAPDGAESEETV